MFAIPAVLDLAAAVLRLKHFWTADMVAGAAAAVAIAAAVATITGGLRHEQLSPV